MRKMAQHTRVTTRKTQEEARFAEAIKEIIDIRVRRAMRQRAEIAPIILASQAAFTFATEGEGFYGNEHPPTTEQHNALHEVAHIEAAIDKIALLSTGGKQGIDDLFPFLGLHCKAIRGKLYPQCINTRTIAPNLVPNEPTRQSLGSEESGTTGIGGDWATPPQQQPQQTEEQTDS